MSPTLWTDWLLFIFAMALGVSALGIMAWALFGDRARGRLRCRKCWYDMAHVGERPDQQCVCPECGTTHASLKDLRRTRRRWRWAMCALMLCFAAFAALVVPVISSSGWPACLPTWLLVRLCAADWPMNKNLGNSWSSQAGAAMTVELRQRELRASDWRTLLRRAHDGYESTPLRISATIYRGPPAVLQMNALWTFACPKNLYWLVRFRSRQPEQPWQVRLLTSRTEPYWTTSVALPDPRTNSPRELEYEVNLVPKTETGIDSLQEVDVSSFELVLQATTSNAASDGTSDLTPR